MRGNENTRKINKSEVLNLVRFIIDNRIYPVQFSKEEAMKFVRKLYRIRPKRMTREEALELLYDAIVPLYDLEETKRTEAVKLAQRMWDSGKSMKAIANELLDVYGVFWDNNDIQLFTKRGIYDKEMKRPFPKIPREMVEKSERFVFSYYKKRGFQGWKITSSIEESGFMNLGRSYEEIDDISKILPKDELTLDQRKILRTTKKMLGKPDLVFLKDKKIIFVEVKLGKGTISKKQNGHFRLLSKGFDIFIIYVKYTPKLNLPPSKRFSIEKIRKFSNTL